MIEPWQYLATIVIICAGYPLGKRVGDIAHDEVKGARKYLLLFRDALFLAAVAAACYANDQTILQYALPIAIIISYFWLWKWYATAYPFLLPIVLLFSRVTTESFIINAALLFLSAFTTGSLQHKELKKPKNFYRYWPVPAIGVIGCILLIIFPF